MQIKLNGDERLSTGFAAAGSNVSITGANADECFGLVSTFRALLVDDMAVIAAPGDIGPAYATFLARQAQNGLSLSDAAPLVGAAAGSFLARVRTRTSSAVVTLVDDGGGRVALSGRNLLVGLAAVTAGAPFTIKLAVGGEQRVFTLYPAGNTSVVVTPDPGDGTIPDGALSVPSGAILSLPSGLYLGVR
jgi:hypothetical protein